MTEEQEESFRPSIELHTCEVTDELQSFKTSFIWKVAFHLDNVQTRTGFRSQSFSAVPLDALKFWLVIIKDDRNAASVRLYQEYKKFLDMTEDNVEANAYISVNEYHSLPECRIMNNETNFVSVTVSKENVNDESFATRVWWVVKCSISVTRTAYLNTCCLHPSGCTNKNDEDAHKTGHLGTITLVTDDCRYKLDKYLLSSRTRLFQNLTDETEIHHSELRSIPKEAMDVVLNYINTGEAIESHQMKSLQVYDAAKLMGVDPLSETCSRTLTKHLDIENVLDVMHLSVVHKDDDLQMEAMKFITGHFDQIKSTHKWADFQNDKFQALRLEKATKYFEDAKNYQPLEKRFQEMTISGNI